MWTGFHHERLAVGSQTRSCYDRPEAKQVMDMRDGVRYKRLGSYLEFSAHPVPVIMLSPL